MEVQGGLQQFRHHHPPQPEDHVVGVAGRREDLDGLPDLVVGEAAGTVAISQGCSSEDTPALFTFFGSRSPFGTVGRNGKDFFDSPSAAVSLIRGLRDGRLKNSSRWRPTGAELADREPKNVNRGRLYPSLGAPLRDRHGSGGLTDPRSGMTVQVFPSAGTTDTVVLRLWGVMMPKLLEPSLNFHRTLAVRRGARLTACWWLAHRCRLGRWALSTRGTGFGSPFSVEPIRNRLHGLDRHAARVGRKRSPRPGRPG